LSVDADLRVGVAPDHRIDAPYPNLMVLVDCGTGQVLLTAIRSDGPWIVRDAGGLNVVQATNRAEAITALIECALHSLSDDSYVTLIPHGLI